MQGIVRKVFFVSFGVHFPRLPAECEFSATWIKCIFLFVCLQQSEDVVPIATGLGPGNCGLCSEGVSEECEELVLGGSVHLRKGAKEHVNVLEEPVAQRSGLEAQVERLGLIHAVVQGQEELAGVGGIPYLVAVFARGHGGNVENVV